MGKEHTLSQYTGTGVNRVNEYEAHCVISKLLPDNNDPQHKTLFGLEIEIENVERVDHVKASMALAQGKNHLPLLWQVKQDGSLRNYGVEFVSYKAIHLESMAGALNWLYSFIKSAYPRADFSSRCGTHAHVDINGFTIEQFHAFIKLYLIYENFFFNYSSPERKNSNFCVPLSKTNFFTWCNEKNSVSWDNFFMHLPGKDYSKYSALNFTRTNDLGTLEFRHMRPTWDVGKIVTTARAIQRIKFYSESSKNQKLINSFIKEANTISNYDSMTREVFGRELAPTIMSHMDNADFSEGVTTAKVFLFQDGFKRAKTRITELFDNTQFIETLSNFKKEVKVGIKEEKDEDYVNLNPNWWQDQDQPPRRGAHAEPQPLGGFNPFEPQYVVDPQLAENVMAAVNNVRGEVRYRHRAVDGVIRQEVDGEQQ